MCWIERERPLDRPVAARGVAELILRELGQRDQRGHLLFGRAGLLGAGVVELAEILPALRAPQQPREMKRGLAVLRIDLERLAQIALGIGLVGRELDVLLGRRTVQRGREAAIGRRRRFLDVLRGELLPVLLADLELAERFGRERVFRAEPKRLVKRRARRRGIEQLAVERHALLEQQVDLTIDLGGRRELDVEELDDGVGPSALRQRFARRGESTRTQVRRRSSCRRRQRVECPRIVRIVLQDGEE